VNRFNTDEIPVLRISASAKMSEPELYDLIDQKSNQFYQTSQALVQYV